MSQLPEWLSEEEFMLAVDHACSFLAKSFTFGYYDSDDIRQEAYIFSLEAISRYDRSRPLENFLFSHIRNRLINFKRDKFHRNDPPCDLCSTGEVHSDGLQCSKYILWYRRNASKQNLMRPTHLDSVGVDYISKKSLLVDSVVDREIFEIIDEFLPSEWRGYYLKMRCGEIVSRLKREAVVKLIRGILHERSAKGSSEFKG